MTSISLPVCLLTPEWESWELYNSTTRGFLNSPECSCSPLSIDVLLNYFLVLTISKFLIFFLMVIKCDHLLKSQATKRSVLVCNPAQWSFFEITGLQWILLRQTTFRIYEQCSKLLQYCILSVATCPISKKSDFCFNVDFTNYQLFF